MTNNSPILSQNAPKKCLSQMKITFVVFFSLITKKIKQFYIKSFSSDYENNNKMPQL